MRGIITRARALFGAARTRAARAVDPAYRAISESRLIAVTIWAPGTFGLPPDRYSTLYRIVLPVFDVSLIYVGWQSILVGVPAFDVVTEGESFGDVWGTILFLSSIAALVGISFPKLLLVETFGKIIVWSCLLVYMGTLLYLSNAGSDSRSVVSGIAVAGLLLASWRLGDIKTERRLRHAKKMAGLTA